LTRARLPLFARPERRFAWLLWLALLLPLAQGAAAWHGYSHVARLTQTQVADAHTLGSHCDLCLAAAAVSGGALASHAPRLALASASHARPELQPNGLFSAAISLAYQSRAPPTSLR
jgi:hypothetical protein